MAPRASFPERSGRLSTFLHTRPPAPAGEEGLTPQQPRPAPPCRAPSLATWKSMDVSKGGGLTVLSKFKERKTGSSSWPPPPPISQNTHQDQRPAGLGIPLLGTQGPAAQQQVRPEGWRRLSSIRRWVGRGREQHTTVGRGGKGSRQSVGSGAAQRSRARPPKSYLELGDRHPAPDGIRKRTAVPKQVFLTPQTLERTLVHQRACPPSLKLVSRSCVPTFPQSGYQKRTSLRT